jgi:hypothetical protein
MSDVLRTWFEQAKKLEWDNTLMIQAIDKPTQVMMYKAFEQLKKEYSNIDPVDAPTYQIAKIYKDGRLWVTITKKMIAPLTGIIKKPDGSYEKIEIDINRKRVIELMKKDGYTKDQIADNLGGLTEEEEENF